MTDLMSCANCPANTVGCNVAASVVDGKHRAEGVRPGSGLYFVL